MLLRAKAFYEAVLPSAPCIERGADKLMGIRGDVGLVSPGWVLGKVKGLLVMCVQWRLLVLLPLLRAPGDTDTGALCNPKEDIQKYRMYCH